MYSKFKNHSKNMRATLIFYYSITTLFININHHKYTQTINPILIKKTKH